MLSGLRTGSPPDPTLIERLAAHFQVAASAAQSIPNGTPTIVAFDTKDYDTLNCFSLALNRFIPDIPSRWLFYGHVCLSSVSDRTILQLHLYKNNSIVREMGRATTSTAFAALAGVAGMLAAEANGTTDYFELVAEHNHGSARNTATGGSYVHFGAACIGLL